MKRAIPEFITNLGKNFATREYSKSEKDALLNYMNNKGELFAAGGYVDDIMTGKETRIESAGFRDEEFEWSTFDIYHIEKYNAAVTTEFLNHVLKKLN